MLKNIRLKNYQIEELLTKLTKDKNMLIYSYITARRQNVTFFGQYKGNQLVAVMAYLKGMPFHAFAFYFEEEEPLENIDLDGLMNYIKNELDLSEDVRGTTIASERELMLLKLNQKVEFEAKDYLMKHINDEKLVEDHLTTLLDESYFYDIKEISEKVDMIAFSEGEMKKFPFVGIIEDDKLVSVASFHIYDDSIVEIGNIGTIEEKRGKGYGKIVTSAVTRIGKEICKDVYLLVFAENISAIKVYEALGYQTIATPYFVEFSF